MITAAKMSLRLPPWGPQLRGRWRQYRGGYVRRDASPRRAHRGAERDRRRSAGASLSSAAGLGHRRVSHQHRWRRTSGAVPRELLDTAHDGRESNASRSTFGVVSIVFGTLIAATVSDASSRLAASPSPWMSTLMLPLVKRLRAESAVCDGRGRPAGPHL